MSLGALAKRRKIRPEASCPCTSGTTYRECCAALHKGWREAETPVELARSRYSAFALGDVEYLLRTLHPEHPERSLPEELLRGTIREACSKYKYTGFTIRDHDQTGTRGRVSFHAKVFARGKDVSFEEDSGFERTAEGWRYLSGETMKTRP